VSDKLDEMWAAFEAHEPAPEYADAWATMLKERTRESMWAAHYVVVGSGSKALASWAAVMAATEAAKAAESAAAADRYAQQAIDALREVKP
jgi:predicted nucleotidyltransferase